jgi:hypothetical protein
VARAFDPLDAFWARDCLPVIDRMLREGDPCVWAIAAAVGARFVSEEEWRLADPDGRAFANANTLADAARLGLERPGDTALGERGTNSSGTTAAPARRSQPTARQEDGLRRHRGRGRPRRS